MYKIYDNQFESSRVSRRANPWRGWLAWFRRPPNFKYCNTPSMAAAVWPELSIYSRKMSPKRSFLREEHAKASLVFLERVPSAHLWPLRHSPIALSLTIKHTRFQPSTRNWNDWLCVDCWWIHFGCRLLEQNQFLVCDFLQVHTERRTSRSVEPNKEDTFDRHYAKAYTTTEHGENARKQSLR